MSQGSIRLADVPLLASTTTSEFAVPASQLPEARRSIPVGAEIDWGRIVILRRRASEQISREIEAYAARTETVMPEVDRRLLGRAIVRRVVHEHAEQASALGEALWPLETERAYAVALENAIFGYGRLQPLFELPEAENIEISGCDSVMIQYGDGHREPHPRVADTDEELVEAIRFLGESVTPSRPFDDAHPTMTLGFSRNRLTRA